MLMTALRARIYTVLETHFSPGTSFDAEALYKVMRTVHVRVSTSTIRYNLREFERAGVIVSVPDSGKRKQYELKPPTQRRATHSKETRE